MRSCVGRASGRGVAYVCAYFVVLAGFIGCERLPAGSAGNQRPSQSELIVLIGPARSSPCWVGIVGGAQRFIERYHPALRLETATPPDNSGPALSQAVRDALSREPRAICLYITDAEAARPAASQAVARGTVVVTMGVACGVTGVFGHVRVDLAGGAELLGEHLAEIVGSRQSYVLLHSRGATPADTRCYDRFMLKARSYHSIKRLDERNAAETDQPATELLRAMFARFRYAGLAVTFDPSPWLRAPPAELLGQNARFATLSAAPALWPFLRSGEAAALVGPLDGEIGSLAVELALVGITKSEKTGLVRTVESELVRPEKLADFARRYAEAAGLDVNELLPSTTASRPAAAPDPAAPP